jgi:DNA-directed RNA polymerase subunit E'/Rpb7
MEVENLNVGPYFNTSFTKTIGLHPNQMNKKLYKNLKNNLVKKYQNKCFGHFGYICKIYGITEKEGGLIIPENSLSPANYKVKFECKLCKPLRGSIIIFEVKVINAMIMVLINGPIHCIISEGFDQINKKNFTFDERRNVLIGHIDEKKGVKVVPGSFVKVRCVESRIHNGTSKIIIIGILDSMASQEEAEKANIERETDDLTFYDYDNYASNDKEISDTNDFVQEENELENENNDDNENTDV